MISRLRELGYEADLAWIANSDYEPIASLPTVNQARELTARGKSAAKLCSNTAYI